MPIKFLNDSSIDGDVQFGAYGSGGITGTTAYNLAVDSSGNIIENSANTRSVFVATLYGHNHKYKCNNYNTLE